MSTAKRWRKDLDTVARRAGQDVADALAEMGEEGISLTHKMATGSSKYLRSMTKDLRELAEASKASLGEYTGQLRQAVKDQTGFEKNLAKLAASGYGDLAKRLAEQGDQDAADLAAQAVKDKKKAKAANDAAASADKTIPSEDLPDLVAIISAVKSKTTGLHAVAEATGLDEDHIIEVANLGLSRIKRALGSKGAKFLSDLSRANKGLSYANGGILTPGLYATSGGLIKFAEPSTGGEAFIPLGAAKRSSALSVLNDVATRFGMRLASGATPPAMRLVDARPPTAIKVTVVQQQPKALVENMPITVQGRDSSPQELSGEIMRRLRNAQRGGADLMLSLSEWQIDFGGVLIGHKTAVSISDVEGLGAAELRTQDVLNPADDGAFPGVDLYAPRTVRIEAGIRTAGDPAAALDKLAEIEAVAANAKIRRTAGALAQLRLRWPGRGTRVLFGRIRRAEAVSTAQAIHGWIPLDLEFTALDPRLHDDEVSSVTLPLDISNSTEGFTAPLVAPHHHRHRHPGNQTGLGDQRRQHRRVADHPDLRTGRQPPHPARRLRARPGPRHHSRGRRAHRHRDPARHAVGPAQRQWQRRLGAVRRITPGPLPDPAGPQRDPLDGRRLHQHHPPDRLVAVGVDRSVRRRTLL
ncbi:hypothetical protein GCM10020295_56910 [Streptomyces cinereospinus]